MLNAMSQEEEEPTKYIIIPENKMKTRTDKET